MTDGDYEGMYADQNNERRVVRYPPYYRLIEVTLKHRDSEVLNKAADWLAAQMRSAFGGRVMGPEYPLVSRIRALYIKTVSVRFERSENIVDAKSLLMQMADDLLKQEGWGRVTVHFDVDPC